MAPQNGRRRNGAVFMGHFLGGRDGARREEIRDVQQSVLAEGGEPALHNHLQEYFTSHPRHLFTELILQLLKVLTEHFFLVSCGLLFQLFYSACSLTVFFFFFLEQDNDATVLQP